MRQIIITLLLCCTYLFSYGQAPAPDFTVTTNKGQELSLYADYLDKGTTVVLELFWEGCPPCNTFAPFFGDLYKDWGSGMDSVEFIALDVMEIETDENVTIFQERHSHTWPGVSAEGGSLEALASFTDGTYGRYLGTPTIIIIAPDGTVAFNVNGFKRDSAGIALIDEAIALSRIPKPTVATVSGSVANADQVAIGNVTLRFDGGDSAVLSPVDVVVDEAGRFSLADLPINQSYTVTPSKMGAIDNGITTFDLVLISKHILGVTPFTDTTQMIAADVNFSGSVTTFDIVQVRRVILGVNDTFNAGSWRFLPEQIELPSLSDLSELSFVGIKVGDVNRSGDPSLFNAAEPRTAARTVPIYVRDKKVQAGELVTVTFSTEAANVLAGFQYTLDFDARALSLIDLSSTVLPNFGEENMNLRHKAQGQIAMSWFDTQKAAPAELFTLQFRAEKNGQLSELLSLSEAITKIEAYTQAEEIVDLALQFIPIPAIESNAVINVFPNPIATAHLTVIVDLPKQQAIQIDLFGIDGKPIQQIRTQVEAGKQTINLPISTSLEAGMYLLKITGSNGLMLIEKLISK